VGAAMAMATAAAMHSQRIMIGAYDDLRLRVGGIRNAAKCAFRHGPALFRPRLRR
jgi:hypothetical protein